MACSKSILGGSSRRAASEETEQLACRLPFQDFLAVARSGSVGEGVFSHLFTRAS